MTGRTVHHHVLIALCAVASVTAAGCRKQQKPPQVTVAGRTWTVELALTPEQQYLGLGGRASLDEGAGMLFVYSRPDVLDFCMRGCVIPLDIAFIDSDLRVVKLHTMAVEPDGVGRIAYSSERPAQYALEVAAGALAEAGVAVGDRVTFSPRVLEAAKAVGGP